MPATQCGNPLWLEWATEVYEKAKANEQQSQFTYYKACKSIRDHPITYQHPREIISLAFVGKKLIQILEKKQAEHYKALGIDPPPPLRTEDEDGDRDDVDGLSNTGKRKFGEGKSKDTAAKSVDPAASSDDSDDPLEIARGPSKKRKPSAKPKAPKSKPPYLPKARSGPYAILANLFLRLPPSSQSAPSFDRADLTAGWTSRLELVRDAQGFCDVDMEKGETGGRYNGWAGMRTLTSNGCVYREGNPARFRLTELGYDAAKAIVINDNLSPYPILPSLPAQPPTTITGHSAMPPREEPPPRPRPSTSSSQYTDFPIDLESDMEIDEGPRPPNPPQSHRPSPLDPRAALEQAVGRDVSRGRLAAGGNLANEIPVPPAGRPGPAPFPMSSPGVGGTSQGVDASMSSQGLSKDLEMDWDAIYAELEGKRKPKVRGWTFWYLAPSGARVASLYHAACRADPVYGVPARHMEFPARLLNHREVTRLMLRDIFIKRDSPNLAEAWIFERNCAPAKCPGKIEDDEVLLAGRAGPPSNSIDPSRSTLARAPNVRPEAGPSSQMGTYTAMTGLPSASLAPFPMSSPRSVAPTSSPILQPTNLDNGTHRGQAVKMSGKSRLVGGGASAPVVASLGSDDVRSGNASASTSNTTQRPPPILAPVRVRPPPILAQDLVGPSATVASAAPIPATPAVAPISTSAITPPPATEFKPGDYEILIVIDNREIKNLRDWRAVETGLVEKGVKVDTRALVVGDMIWVARHKDGRECVLDHVVERKRLDDLVNSITGGRYDEQKHRLKGSKLRNIHYVVEDWNLQKTTDSLVKAVATTRSQLQMIHGIFLKDTHRLQETIDFLKVMTDSIKHQYESETLYVLEDSHTTSLAQYGPLQDRLRTVYPERFYVTSYDTYAQLNSKSANCTLKETWTRMLLCVRGMSEEKVRNVVDVWESPRALWEAVEQRREEIERELGEEAASGTVVPGAKGARGKSKVRGIEVFLADRFGHLPSRQKIGEALSKDIYLALYG